MADLATTYMGVALRNPLIVAASSISNYVDKVKKAEEIGAGALVIRSLFEEQIQHDEMTMSDSWSAAYIAGDRRRSTRPSSRQAARALDVVERRAAPSRCPSSPA